MNLLTGWENSADTSGNGEMGQHALPCVCVAGSVPCASSGVAAGSQYTWRVMNQLESTVGGKCSWYGSKIKRILSFQSSCKYLELSINQYLVPVATRHRSAQTDQTYRGLAGATKAEVISGHGPK